MSQSPYGSNWHYCTGSTAPTQLNVDHSIQYGTKSGDYLYGLAVAPLDLKFDMTSGDTVVFIKLLAARSREMGWSEWAMNITTFNIDTTGTAPNIKDLFTQYGQIPAKVIKERCDKFITGPDVQTSSNQNNAIMHKCLLAILTDEAKRKLTTCESDYIYNNEVYAPLLFKTIMRLATIDSMATANFLRESLNSCGSYMVSALPTSTNSICSSPPPTLSCWVEENQLMTLWCHCGRDTLPPRITTFMPTLNASNKNTSKRKMT